MAPQIEINTCDDCPYSRRWNDYCSDDPYRCNHQYAPYPINDERSENTSEGDPPDWCPLRNIEKAKLIREINDLKRRKGDLTHRDGILRNRIERANKKIVLATAEITEAEKKLSRTNIELTEVLQEIDKLSRKTIASK